MNTPGENRVVVRSLTWHTPDIFELGVEHPGCAFVPGDCVALYQRQGTASRPYSIASGIHDEAWRFLIRRLPGGEVSADLAQCAPGDSVRITPPFGWFRPGQDESGSAAVFVATGTGIAPFWSYLRSYPDRPPVRCLYGVRQRADAVAVEWLRERCWLDLAVSRETAPDAHHGRVTDLLPSLPLDSATHYYLCGLDTMLDDVSRWLEARGVGLERIHRECFFNAQ